MVTYYKIGDMFCASAHGDLPYEKTEKPAAGTMLTWLFTGEPGSRRASFLVNHPVELFAECEDVSWLNTNRLNASAYGGQIRELPAELLGLALLGYVVNDDKNAAQTLLVKGGEQKLQAAAAHIPLTVQVAGLLHGQHPWRGAMSEKSVS